MQLYSRRNISTGLTMRAPSVTSILYKAIVLMPLTVPRQDSATWGFCALHYNSDCLRTTRTAASMPLQSTIDNLVGVSGSIANRLGCKHSVEVTAGITARMACKGWPATFDCSFGATACADGACMSASIHTRGEELQD